MIKILNTIGEVFAPKAKETLEDIAEVVYATPLQEELAHLAEDVDVLLVGLGLNIDKAVIDAAKNLKVIATATTGLDHIDVSYAESKGIKVISLRGENEFLDTITGTAELAFGLMIASMRHIPKAYHAVHKEGKWQRENFRGNSLYGKTLGIVGMGRLGKIVAEGAKGFRMNVVFCDPYVEQEAYPEYKKVSLDELLKESDVISIHVHLNDETTHMFNKDVFKKAKNSVHIINTSRGKIVHEEDLINALREGEIVGYATDVLDGQTEFGEDANEHPLVEYARTASNVIIVPHLGGMTHDSREATDVFIAEKVRNHLS